MYRLQKLLSNYGYCSRRKAQELIEQGRVRVGNKVVSTGQKASEKDNIYVDGKLVRRPGKIYLMLNKPLNCVTALTDKRHKTVMDYISSRVRIFPVGRLDYNTSGLLLFTNDGDFANNIMHPRYQIKKTYLVEVNKAIENRQICLIKTGIELKDGKTRPAKVKMLKPNLLEVTIHEGKKRIVRRIFQKLGFEVNMLSRIRVGQLSLGGLKSGKCRPLTEKDRMKIFAQAAT